MCEACDHIVGNELGKEVPPLRDEFVFTDCNIREYWDEVEKLWVDRDINAAINLKRLGLDVFPSIKRRKGSIVIVGSITDATSKEVLHTLRGI